MNRKQLINFWANVEQVGGCWIWRGSSVSKGYGRFNNGGKIVATHRLAFELVKGPIPDGQQVLHHCDNPGCINPNCLFAGTGLDNMVDKSAKGRHHNQRKTECPAGHPYNIENTYNRNGRRYCKACLNNHKRNDK